MEAIYTADIYMYNHKHTTIYMAYKKKMSNCLAYYKKKLRN